MDKSISDELQKILDTQKALLGEAENLYDMIAERVTDPLVDALGRQIEEKNQQLTKLTAELCVANELIAGYQKDEEECKTCRQDLEAKLGHAREEVKRLKSNTSIHIEEIKALRKVADNYAVATQNTIDMFDELYCSEVDTTKPSPEIVYHPCTAIFVCCGDDHHESRNSQRFARLKGLLPSVDFVGDQPIFISSRNTVRPPFPVVDLVILFTAGLSHTDGDAIRNDIRRDNPEAHISTHISSVSLILLEIRQWLTNPDFAKVSTT